MSAVAEDARRAVDIASDAAPTLYTGDRNSYSYEPHPAVVGPLSAAVFAALVAERTKAKG